MINQAISTLKPPLNEISAKYIDNFNMILVIIQIIITAILKDHNNINHIISNGSVIHL
jgi:hypothetical protein